MKHGGAPTGSARPEPETESPPEEQNAAAYDSFYDELARKVPLAAGASRADVHQHVGTIIDRAILEARRIEGQLVATHRLDASDAARLRELSELLLQRGQYLSDAWQWAPGPYWIEGLDRSDTWLGSAEGYRVAELFLLRSLQLRDVKGYAEYIRANHRRLDGAERTLSRMRERSEKWLARAPESALPNPDCMVMCILGRVDYQKRLRELDAFDETVTALARLVCRIWPELATEMGGVFECEHTIKAHHVADLPWSPMKAEQDEEDDPFKASMPGRDAPYARFADPLHLACLFDDAGKERSERSVGACILAGRREQMEKLERRRDPGAATIDEAVSLSRTVCRLDSVGHELNRSGQTFERCDWLADLHLAYLAYAWDRGEAGSFASHVRFRRTWSERVRDGFSKISRIVALSPCGKFDLDHCRPTYLDEAAWRNMVAAANEIGPAAEAWGTEICRVWPELNGALGHECPQLMGDYLVSFGLNVPFGLDGK